jgi:hypothetical protein
MTDVQTDASPHSAQVTVSTTATKIGTQPATKVGRATGGVIFNAPSTNTAVVFVGDSSATTGNGFLLAADDSVADSCDDPSRLHGIVAAGTRTIAVLYL